MEITRQKKGRGGISVQVTFDIALVRWYDNSIVSIESNAYGALPSTTVNRIVSIDKKRAELSVSCPQVVSKYYKFM